MKFLLYSDIHHGSSFRYGTISNNGLNSRLIASLSIEDWITSLIEEKGIDLVIFLGDLVERSIYSYINDLVREKLTQRFKIRPFLVLRGNHDKYFKGFDVYGDVFNPFKSDFIIREVQVLDFKGIKLGFLPYGVEQTLKEKVDFLFVHRDIKGASITSNVKMEIGVEINHLSQSAGKVFCGHIHYPQLLANNLLCLGSVVATDLSECDGQERGVYIYDTEKGEIELIDVPVPKLTRIALRIEKSDDLDFFKESLLKVKGNNVVCNIEVLKKYQSKVYMIRDELSSQFENISLIFRPIETDDERAREKFIEILGTQSLEERLLRFVEGMEAKLDKKDLYKTGLQLLNRVERESDGIKD